MANTAQQTTRSTLKVRLGEKAESSDRESIDCDSKDALKFFD